MFKAEMLADSLHPLGSRLTTMLLTYPRIIHCFDPLTEVLCRIDGSTGFRPFPEVCNLPPEKQLLIAAYTPGTDPECRSGSIHFERPAVMTAEPYEGDMLSVKNQRLDFCVTPNHRMLVGSRKKDRDLFEVVLAKDLIGATQKRIPTSGFVRDGEILVPGMAELVGFFVGDGTLTKANKAVFHLKKTRKIEYLHDLLNQLGIAYDFRAYRDGTTNTVFRGLDWMRECYRDKVKRIPDRFLRASYGDLRGLLHGLWFSDGHHTRGPVSEFNTSSLEVADQISAVACMCGLRVGPPTKQAGGVVKITLSAKEDFPVLRKDKNPIQSRKYSGMVYCATVSTGFLLVRRNKKVMVSGNSEFLTHRTHSRNAASSRAIPVEKQIQAIIDDPFIPIHWGVNQSGMQAYGVHPEPGLCESIWRVALQEAIQSARRLNNQGLHKQIVNRVIEPYSWITVIATSCAPGWRNMFKLRCHEAAEPHFQKIARMAEQLWYDHKPRMMAVGEWHLPLFGFEGDENIPFDDRKKISAARCARVSYLTHDGQRNIGKDLMLHDRLISSNPKHMSSFEHQAQCVMGYPLTELYTGNLETGWMQYRKTIKGERAE